MRVGRCNGETGKQRVGEDACRAAGDGLSTRNRNGTSTAAV